MRPFAVVSGDHNPIHTSRAAALLAGLESPIVHGMWLSAAAQHVDAATDGTAIRRPGWSAGPPASSAWCSPAMRSTSGSTVSESTWAPRWSRLPPASAPIW